MACNTCQKGPMDILSGGQTPQAVKHLLQHDLSLNFLLAESCPVIFLGAIDLLYVNRTGRIGTYN